MGFSWKWDFRENVDQQKISRYMVYCLLVSKWSHSQTFSMVQEFSLGMRLFLRSKVMAIVTTLRSFFKLCKPFINGLPALHVRLTWTIDKPIWLCGYRKAGNIRGRKPSRISWFCGCSQKFSLRNLEVWHLLAQHKRAICESFIHENHIFHQFAKVFSLESFPLDQYIQGKAS